MYKMLRLIVIFRLAVVGVILIGGTIGSVSKQTQVGKIHAGHVLDRLAALGDGQDLELHKQEILGIGGLSDCGMVFSLANKNARESA